LGDIITGIYNKIDDFFVKYYTLYVQSLDQLEGHGNQSLTLFDN